MRVRPRELVQMLGTAGAVVAWLGWFEIAPALGFPTIGPAAMLNRLFLPESDPGVWLGWALMVLGLIAVAALYALARARGWIPPGPLAGLLVGVAVWAIGGMVLMVIIGHISPPAPAPPPPPGPPLPTTPDPMHATFLMLHLGALAPVEALAAWLLFGAIVGATSLSIEQAGVKSATRADRVTGTLPAGGLLALAVALTVGGWIAGSQTAGALGQAPAGVTSRVLATGPAKALPEGAVFVSVIELPQAPGATLGPHAHVPGFAYVLRGRETISFAGRPTLELDAGQGGFMGALAIHSHQNRNRVPAAVLAIGLLALGLALSAVSLTRIATRRAAMAVLGGVLVVAGAVALWDPWVNDWFFIGVRPEAARGGVMPLPNASRVYESPDLEGLSAGPYTETLRLIAVPAGGQTTVQREPGAETFLVLSGNAAIAVNGDSPISLGTSQAALAQQGRSVRISNSGGEMLSLLSFSVVGSGRSQ
jgi:quercetin dioxygenase-like cupin family protein/mannose-6-phosphate isomerase-like protein (cupin superfamily)